MSNRPPSLRSLRKASTLPQLTLSEAFGRSATVAAGAVAAAKKSDISSSGDEGSSTGEESDEVVVVEEVAGEVAQAARSTAVDKPDEVDVVASGGTPNDIGEGYNLASQKWTCLPSSLSSDEKRRLVDHHFVPGPKHDFPVHTGNDGRNRRFRHQWLEDNTWLVYSPKCDGGFCLPCLLFPSGADQGQLTARPMSNFKKATTLLDKHGSQATHKDAVARQGQFKKVVSAGQPDVVDQLVDAHAIQSQENEQKLKGILDCVIFCGKQNLAFRGHRNETLCVSVPDARTNSTTHDESGDISLTAADTNPGNFISLLEFRANAGDASIIRDFHLHAGGAGHSVTYCSGKSQNELIDCCAEYIREELLKTIRAAPFVSILADEATDTANMEQMPIVVRYVSGYEVKEEFLGFVNCDTGITGNALATKIKGALESWNLDLKKWRGQGYDGAANMAGRLNGCAAIIQRELPKAVYYHCSSHALNLCIMAASKISLVSNMWTALREVSLFFENSPKRQLKLEKIIDETPDNEMNNSQKKKLVSLCRTRWVQRHTALDTFADLFPAVVATMEAIADDRAHWSADTCGMASSLLRSITDFSFLVTFGVVYHVMAYLVGLSVGLQEKSLDVCRAYKQIANTKATLEKVRADIDKSHATWFTKAVDMARGVNVQPSIPRTCRRQQGRDNVPAATSEEYYRRAVSVPLLDELVGEFNSRFGPLQLKIGKGMSIFPDCLLANPEQAKADVLSFVKDAEDDLPVGCSFITFQAELDIFHTVLTKCPANQRPTSLTQCAKMADESLCKGVAQVLTLLATLPVTTCTCERSISSLRRLKTYLRSTMTGERLTGLALLHVHYAMPVDKNEVLKIFFRRSPRRVLSQYDDK
ncbi:52 kDa repressor of the inhibitor of the protein kinase-like [Sycon ciliatum]|uniref:52 kDa repressor of the inhibitor of the protein kinase-like n=1 Tax=Sycon ciliatum TaxID=27933 RepID=UPI0031F61396